MTGERRRVVWTASLVVALVGLELLLLGLVGVTADSSRSESVTLSFPDGKGSAIVVFAPTPTWGGRALRLDVPTQPTLPYVGPGVPGSLPASLGASGAVYSCADRSCTRLGGFRVDWLVIYSDPSAPEYLTQNMTDSTTSTVFLVTLFYAPAPARVVLTGVWFALTSAGIISLEVAIAGGLTLVAAWVVARTSDWLGSRTELQPTFSHACWRCARAVPGWGGDCPWCGATSDGSSG